MCGSKRKGNGKKAAMAAKMRAPRRKHKKIKNSLRAYSFRNPQEDWIVALICSSAKFMKPSWEELKESDLNHVRINLFNSFEIYTSHVLRMPLTFLCCSST